MLPFFRKAVGFCYLRDQQPISSAAYQRALALCETIRELVASRAAYVRREGLCPEIHLPRGNWEADSGLFAAYSTVVKGDYSVINNLRLFAQIFTGYKLMELCGDPGLTIPHAVPPDLDGWLAKKAANRSGDVNRYQKLKACLPEVFHVAPPKMFGEIGWLVDGKIVNHDTNVYLERIALLAESGILLELHNRTSETPATENRSWQRPRIVEIGSGYGALAHYLRTLIPDARYYLVDIPESLLFSSIYLSTLWENTDSVLITPDNLDDLKKDTPGFTFVPNYLFDQCVATGFAFDLAINTLSMSEMAAEQVRYYCDGIAKLLADRGVFFEQNQDSRRLGLLDARTMIAKHLPLCVRLCPATFRPWQGQAHLWATNPVPPHAWRSSADVLSIRPSAWEIARTGLGKLRHTARSVARIGN